jgi:hypothetical protein
MAAAALPELGHRDRPPLLENVARDGPLRILAGKNALPSRAEREYVEDNYGWFRYSTCSGGYLVVLLLLALTVWCLTLWQVQGSWIRGLEDGIPRHLRHQDVENDDNVGRYYQLIGNVWEGSQGQDNVLWALRMAYCITGITSVLLLYGVYFNRLRSVIRRIATIFLCFALFVASMVALVAFGLTLERVDNLWHAPPFLRYTFEKQEKMEDLYTFLCILDVSVFVTAFFTSLAVGYYSWKGHFQARRRGWLSRERDETDDGLRVQGPLKRVRYARTQLSHIFLVATLTTLAVASFFTVYTYEDTYQVTKAFDFYPDFNRATTAATNGKTKVAEGLNVAVWTGPNSDAVDNVYAHGRIREVTTMRPWEKAGWPVVNVRIRYICTLLAMLVILTNLLPIRSRVFAYIFCYLYIAIGGALLAGSILDVIALSDTGVDDGDADETDQWPCPNDPSTWNRNTGSIQQFSCYRQNFLVTVVFEWILAIVLIWYALYQYLLRRPCPYCLHKFTIFDLGGLPVLGDGSCHKAVCSQRPVVCEVCHKTFTAKDFYYSHRLTCGADHQQCPECHQWIPQWQWATHSEFCLHWKVSCSMCTRVLPRGEMPAHIRECPNRPVPCRFCGQTFRFTQMQSHLQVCQDVIEQCPQCGTAMQRYRLNDHRELECTHRLVPCEMCQLPVPFYQLQEHQRRECPMRIITCELCGEHVVFQDKERHVCPALQ